MAQKWLNTIVPRHRLRKSRVRPFQGDPCNDHRSRCAEAHQGQGSQVRRPPLHRYPRQGAARHRCRSRRSANDKFEQGHAFDGSSIAGWKGIQASDMLLMPDPTTAHSIRSWTRRRCYITCDVVEPSDGKGYERDPRSLAQARRGVPQIHRPRRRRLFRSGAGILHLRRGRVVGRHVGQLLQDLLIRGGVVDRREVRGRQHGPPPAIKGGYFPGAAGRFAAGHPLGDLPRARADGRRSRGAPPRGRERRPVRDRHQVRAAGAARRLAADPEVLRAQRRARVRQDGDVHAEADRRRQRLGHARAPVGLEGRQEPVRRRRLRGPVGIRAVLHRRHHQAREGAERDHQSRHQLVQAPGARLRGADQSRVLGAQPLGVVPHSVRVAARRGAASKCASRIRRRTRTSPSRRC